MFNCSKDITVEVRCKILEQFCRKMVTSGYKKPLIAKVLRNGLIGYNRAINLENKGTRPVHQKLPVGTNKRIRKKLLDKTNWFKNKPREMDEIDLVDRGSN